MPSKVNHWELMTPGASPPGEGTSARAEVKRDATTGWGGASRILWVWGGGRSERTDRFLNPCYASQVTLNGGFRKRTL
jgi:hypothetical protein